MMDDFLIDYCRRLSPKDFKVNSENLGRTHIRAFGKFAVCEEDNVVYGKIFFGFIGLQPVFNLDIEICQDSIRWIVMSGFSINDVVTYRFLNCVIIE